MGIGWPGVGGSRDNRCGGGGMSGRPSEGWCVVATPKKDRSGVGGWGERDVKFSVVGEVGSQVANAVRDKIMEKEAKKEAFRKYLESSGVLDALTKVLVSLYEQNEKPSSAVEFVQQKLGGPSLAEYEKLQAEISDLQIRYNELLAVHQEKCREYEEFKRTDVEASSCKETVERNEGL
ncbi:hypothetical protein BUALT_Bualt01G0124400 [Buddleja alternifolia]|uniref:c-Myc-binding protein n=1 Tax=Buddleja alternifolia TaxID=168488 RepID=A0AAV6Y6K1_9LAMI|nr:hypothetical protein BUALT_Bualt01G0124400 [Buddleja alternifolia]